MFNLFNKSAAKIAAATKRAQDKRIAIVEELGVPYDVADDGTITIKGDVDVSRRKLTKLPDLTDVVVDGDFICTDNALKTLRGAPKIVKGRFDCSRNSLTSLGHGPKEVGGEYACANNFLTDLQGSPREVLTMDCSNNDLLSLHGAPDRVKSTFVCVNTALFDLEYVPREIAGDCIVTKARIETLKYAPEKFGCLVTDFGDFRSREEIPAELGGRWASPKEPPKPPIADDSLTLKKTINVKGPLALVPKK